MTCNRITLVSLVLAIELVASEGMAQQSSAPSEDPEMLIHIGNDLRRKGDDKRAEGYLRRAYQLARTPRSAAQLGLVEMALGNYVGADQRLTEALAGDDSWVADNKPKLTESRDIVRQNLVAVEIVGAPQEARIRFGDGAVRDLPPDATLWLAPGRVALTVTADRHRTGAVDVVGTKGQHLRVEVAMPAMEDLAPASPRPVEAAATAAGTGTDVTAGGASSGRSLRIAGLAVGGAGIAAAILGAVLLVEGNSKKSDYENPSKPFDPSTANYGTFQNAGVGVVVGGGALVVGGVVMYIVGGRHAVDGSSVSFEMGPHGGTVGWGGQF